VISRILPLNAPCTLLGVGALTSIGVLALTMASEVFIEDIEEVSKIAFRGIYTPRCNLSRPRYLAKADRCIFFNGSL